MHMIMEHRLSSNLFAILKNIKSIRAEDICHLLCHLFCLPCHLFVYLAYVLFALPAGVSAIFVSSLFLSPLYPSLSLSIPRLAVIATLNKNLLFQHGGFLSGVAQIYATCCERVAYGLMRGAAVQLLLQTY